MSDDLSATPAQTIPASSEAEPPRLTWTNSGPTRHPNSNLGRPKTWTDERIGEALHAERGQAPAAARWLAVRYGRECSDETVRAALRRSQALRDVAAAAQARAVNLALLTVMDRAEVCQDQKDQHFLIRAFHPDVVRRHEHSGPKGGPMQHEVTQKVADGVIPYPQMAAMSDAYLATLIEAGRIVNELRRGDTHQRRGGDAGDVAPPL